METVEAVARVLALGVETPAGPFAVPWLVVEPGPEAGPEVIRGLWMELRSGWLAPSAEIGLWATLFGRAGLKLGVWPGSRCLLDGRGDGWTVVLEGPGWRFDLGRLGQAEGDVVKELALITGRLFVSAGDGEVFFGGGVAAVEEVVVLEAA